MNASKEDLKEIENVLDRLEKVAESFCELMAGYRQKQVFNDSEKAGSFADVLEKATLDLRVVYGEVSEVQNEIEKENIQAYRPSLFNLILRLLTLGLVGGRR
ncbi:MAG: hypothetical protein CL524_01090 [Aequorivita sp.]|nr:hypothetical protein [Aequorivita sp.]|tara:strand:+ start:239 stop:544 length:306 start_codon:yes stop_codon:yes gene_type:complete